MQERQLARRLQICFPERGHQTGVYLLPADRPAPLAYQDSPVVSEYFRQCEAERRGRRGEWGRLIGSPGEIFPNTALHPRQPRTIAVWHPRGPHQTEVWRGYLVDQKAPPEVKDFLRQYYIRYSGPAGLTEQDDMENWEYARAASRRTIAQRHPSAGRRLGVRALLVLAERRCVGRDRRDDLRARCCGDSASTLDVC